MKELIPWYLNNTLAPADRRKVEAWLAARPDREVLLRISQQIQQVVQDQPVHPAPRGVEGRLRATLRSRRAPGAHKDQAARWAWTFGFLLMTVVLFGLWFTFQPGVVLEWSAASQTMETYQVYRAAQGSATFELLHEVTPRKPQARYSYIDLALWPGQTYSYRVVGIAANGFAANSPVVTGDTLQLIQTQLSIVLISLVAGYGGIWLARLWRSAQRLPKLAFG